MVPLSLEIRQQGEKLWLLRVERELHSLGETVLETLRLDHHPSEMLHFLGCQVKHPFDWEDSPPMSDDPDDYGDLIAFSDRDGISVWGDPNRVEWANFVKKFIPSIPVTSVCLEA